ncbi:hypothetical protein DH2020_048492 [Rehmannia glutinosa]|uniref:CCHC-type domain-containing protein n=1 Tax=Rehmannia glutinosa TaxID=99300 RepID=A0ABR0U5G8_REHGL
MSTLSLSLLCGLCNHLMDEELSNIYAKLTLGEEEKSSLNADTFHIQASNISSSLVGKIIAPRIINIDQISSLFRKLWNPRGSLHCKALHDNVVLFSFSDAVDRKRVQLGAPWLLDRYLMPYEQRLCKICGQLHRLFLDVDSVTTGSVVGKFLRVRCEIDISKPLRRVVNIHFQGKKLLISLKYECLPDFCFFCGRIGHIAKDCDLRIMNVPQQNDGFEYGIWLRVSSTISPFFLLTTNPVVPRNQTLLTPTANPPQLTNHSSPANHKSHTHPTTSITNIILTPDNNTTVVPNSGSPSLSTLDRLTPSPHNLTTNNNNNITKHVSSLHIPILTHCIPIRSHPSPLYTSSPSSSPPLEPTPHHPLLLEPTPLPTMLRPLLLPFITPTP